MTTVMKNMTTVTTFFLVICLVIKTVAHTAGIIDFVVLFSCLLDNHCSYVFTENSHDH